MNLEPIESTYFNWLYNKVAATPNPTPSLMYYNLLGILHTTEFVWLLSGDDNRAEDGIQLRHEFLNESRIPAEEGWLSSACSVLEMLIAFSRRAEFETDVSSRDWFWIFLDNLRLSDFNDAKPDRHHRIDLTLDRLVWRTYARDGNGGIFPMNKPEHDQRQIEIWYQFCEYLVDK